MGSITCWQAQADKSPVSDCWPPGCKVLQNVQQLFSNASHFIFICSPTALDQLCQGLALSQVLHTQAAKKLGSSGAGTDGSSPDMPNCHLTSSSDWVASTEFHENEANAQCSFKHWVARTELHKNVAHAHCSLKQALRRWLDGSKLA